MFQRAAELLGLAPGECAVIEDAESGVKAGATGPFALVIGVDRGVGREALAELGADVIVDELDELIPRPRARRRGIRPGIRHPIPPPHADHRRGPRMRFADTDPLNRSRLPRRRVGARRDGFGLDDMGRTETLFAVGNGYLGLRGNVEEGRDGHMHGTFVNGFHETWPIRHAEEAFGFARVGQTIVNAPDAKIIRLYVDDEPLVITEAEIMSLRAPARLPARRAQPPDRVAHAVGQARAHHEPPHGELHRPPPRRSSTTRSSCSTRMPR